MFNLNNQNKFFKLPRSIDNILHFITLGRLATGIFHDLINPLTALLITLNNSNQKSEILESSKNLSDFIEIIQKQIKNNQINESFCISKTIEETLILIKYKALLNNVRLININESTVYIFGKRSVIIRTLLNLINNAIDSYENCPREKQDVVISSYSDNDFVYISVKDYGCGISKQNQRKIFRYFYTNKKTGTGIGLASSHHLIKKEFSGKIKIESLLGEGSNFIIKIPLKTSVNLNINK